MTDEVRWIQEKYYWRTSDGKYTVTKALYEGEKFVAFAGKTEGRGSFAKYPTMLGWADTMREAAALCRRHYEASPERAQGSLL